MAGLVASTIERQELSEWIVCCFQSLISFELLQYHEIFIMDSSLKKPSSFSLIDNLSEIEQGQNFQLLS
jgi:hypothetical protein